MKRIMLLCSFLIIACFVVGINVQAAADIDIQNNQNGTITVKYDNSAGDKIKVVVVKSDSTKKYTYDIPTGQKKINCGLSQGNGTYIVKVCKNSSGKKYSVLHTEKVVQKLKDPNQVFLGSNQIVNWTTTNHAITYANQLTKNSKTEMKKIETVYKYIVENYSYDYKKLKKINNTTGYIPNIDSVYRSKKGICYDIAALNASMLRSLGIETKLIMGYSTQPGLSGVYHAWNKVYNSDTKQWMILDLTYDMSKYDKADYKVMKKSAKYYSNESYVY